MKKILFLLLLGFGVVATQEVSAQSTTTKTTKTTTTYRYYYYPNANVYYNTESGDYWIYEEPTTKWITTRTLPSGVVVEKTPRYIVRYDNNEPWKENEVHIKKFKVKKNGDVKIKTKTDN